MGRSHCKKCGRSVTTAENDQRVECSQCQAARREATNTARRDKRAKAKEAKPKAEEG